MLQGQRDLFTVGRTAAVRTRPARRRAAGHDLPDGRRRAPPAASAPARRLCAAPRASRPRSRSARGLVGQCAVEKQRILLNHVPADYTRVSSSLGQAVPVAIVVIPVLFEGQTKAVIELASLQPFSVTHLTFLEQLTQSIGVVLNTIEATMRTEGLLQQSQELTVELQSQQKELQQTNEELAQKARQLAEQNVEVERKNQEGRAGPPRARGKGGRARAHVESTSPSSSPTCRTSCARRSIRSSSSASSWPRTPAATSRPSRPRFARNIYSSGSDLLNLITDILDLSKIESGTVTVEAEEIGFTMLREAVERNFRHIADAKNLPFKVEFDPGMPRAIITDPKRLQQILKNLLSNAFKFTRRATSPSTCVSRRAAGASVTPCSAARRRSSPSPSAIPASASPRKSRSSSSRRSSRPTPAPAASTAARGLGLAISRELAALLGGEIRLSSTAGRGQRLHPLSAALLYGRHHQGACRRRAGGPAGRPRGAHRRRP